MPKHQKYSTFNRGSTNLQDINLIRNKIKSQIIIDENTQVPCYVSERLLRLDQVTRFPCTLKYLDYLYSQRSTYTTTTTKG